jgi:UDPglucose 6-dehydrogenase
MSAGGQFENPRISVLGLGKLGSVVAGCHASKGFRVIGCDVDARVVSCVRRGVAPISEPGVTELFAASQPRLDATSDAVKAVRETDVTMLAVPTPSLESGGYSLRQVLEACEAIGGAIAEKGSYHLVVLKSTVMPGASRNEIIPFLERAAGGRAGVDFGYCYNPEFIALGSVVRNIFNPDLVLIGESDGRAGDILVGIYERLLDRPAAPIARMNCVNAEIAKLAVNSFVTMKITFANLLALMCERLPGGDVDQVTSALGLDSRIGAKCLKGGLGFGGPCFPRDNQAVLSLARELELPFPLAAATEEANAGITLRVVDMLAERIRPGARVAVLGLSYKPDTPVVEESQGLLLASALVARGFDVGVYDPQAAENARAVLGDSVSYAASVEACVSGAESVVIATDWPEFSGTPQLVAAPPGAPPVLIIDCWGSLEREPEGVEVLRLGTYQS